MLAACLAGLLLGAPVAVHVGSSQGLEPGTAIRIAGLIVRAIEESSGQAVEVSALAPEQCTVKADCVALIRKSAAHVVWVQMIMGVTKIAVFAELAGDPAGKRRADLDVDPASWGAPIAELVKGLVPRKDIALAPSPAPQPTALVVPPEPRGTPPLAYGGVAAGGAGVVAGIALLIAAELERGSLAAALENRQDGKIVGITYDSASADRDRIVALRTAGGVATSVGSAVVAGALYLWLSD